MNVNVKELINETLRKGIEDLLPIDAIARISACGQENGIPDLVKGQRYHITQLHKQRNIHYAIVKMNGRDVMWNASHFEMDDDADSPNKDAPTEGKFEHQIIHEEQQEMAEKIIEGLQLKKDNTGTVGTIWGRKSPIGLYRCIEHIMKGE